MRGFPHRRRAKQQTLRNQGLQTQEFKVTSKLQESMFKKSSCQAPRPHEFNNHDFKLKIHNYNIELCQQFLILEFAIQDSIVQRFQIDSSQVIVHNSQDTVHKR